MAMIDIEYRYSAEPLIIGEVRRQSNAEMEEYLRNLVFEMQMADISAKYTGVKTDEDDNVLLINGKNVLDILNGLEIIPLEPDEDSCNCDKPKPISIGRPMIIWDKCIIEDIPDVMVKNAISKVYSDIQKNRIM